MPPRPRETFITAMKTIQGKTLPLPRWWLRTRPDTRGNQLNASGSLSPCVIFYVPWWGWPFEFMHRLLFGCPKIKP